MLILSPRRRPSVHRQSQRNDAPAAKLSAGLAASGLALALGLGGCSSSWSTVTATQVSSVPARAGEPLRLEAANGSVKIEPWDQSTAEITARISAQSSERLNATEIRAEPLPGGGLHVFAVFPPPGRKNAEGCAFTIRMPATGETTIRTSNGSIELSGGRGLASLETSNGSITLSDRDGPAVLDTSNGRIVVENLTGNLEADTSNGSIRIVNAGGAVDVSSTNGSAFVSLAPSSNGPVDVDTSNGSIEFRAPASFAGAIELDRSNGRSRVHQAGKLVFSTRGDSHYGDGPRRARLDTSNGNIDVYLEAPDHSEPAPKPNSN
ncbi:MAG: hypothetical protein SFZ23_11665 [Planctomycetota bacterium]|nr:hypothetical protein [Planctomycetota bacterium]